MIECPDCHAVLRPNAKRCACGWIEHSARSPNGPPASLPDPLRWNCIDEQAGQRCAKLGRFSSSTQGGDRFYCEDHYPPFRSMRAGERYAPSEGFRAIAARLRQKAQLAADVAAQELREIDDETRREREAIQAEGSGRMLVGAR